MNPLSATVRALLWKELRQIRRSRTALPTATVLPVLLLVVVPLGQLAALRAETDSSTGSMGTAGLGARFSDPLELFIQVLLPLFVTLAGLLVVPVTATYTIVAERERRSLDLLMALPATVEDILAAKLLAVLAVGSCLTVPLFAVDAAVLLTLGILPAGHAALLLGVLLAALACSVGLTFVVTLLSRDFRTANNVSALQTMPVLLAALAVLLALPGAAGLVAVTALLLAAGTLAALAARRWITFERYLT